MKSVDVSKQVGEGYLDEWGIPRGMVKEWRPEGSFEDQNIGIFV